MKDNRHDNLMPIAYGLDGDIYKDYVRTPMYNEDIGIPINNIDHARVEEYAHFSISSSTRTFKVDFDKVKTLDDVKLILEAIQIGFNINFCENYEKFSELEKLLKEVK